MMMPNCLTLLSSTMVLMSTALLEAGFPMHSIPTTTHLRSPLSL